MPVSYSLPCKNADGTEATIEGELADEHIELFADFIEHAERLRQSDFIRGGGQVNLNVSWKEGTAVKADATIPDRPPYSEFLHEIRPFILENEPTHFYKILGIAGRLIPDPCFRAVLKAAKDVFAGKRIADQVRVTVGDRDVISDTFVRDWLNAFEYHRARDKRKELEAMHEAVPLESTEALVLMQLVDKASAVFYLSRIMERLIGYGTPE